MAASMSSAFCSASPASASKKALGYPPHSLHVRGVAAKTGTPPAAVRVGGTRVHAVTKVNGGKAAVADGEEEEPVRSSSAPSTLENQTPDWSVLLAAVTTVFLAAERQWKPKRPEMLADTFGLGRIVHGGVVFRQDFSIRSYEIGADKTASIETVLNHLQETALNHVKSVGLLGDGLGSTPEMSKRNLFWVVCQMQLLVEQYPCWGDTVRVDTWASRHGKNAMRRDWHLRDLNTGQTILRATSKSVLVNKLTRKISRIPDEVWTEIGPHFLDRAAIPDEANLKLPKQPEHDGAIAMKYARTGLTPRWSDLDINQHVNNVKYIGWILESAPISILENHELASMVLEYKRECGRDSTLQSHTTVSADCADGSGEPTLQCEHLLSLESGPTIVKARTMWRPKRPQTTLETTA